ncbi:cytochrome c [Hydrogenophaga sp. 2FB]|uniref:SorU family sulfite dehydrogenase c-type cytochrome subunit n=1 Tax=Hydrogenophaga sp. 2FB TaxID=2502187 RepID=UPI0010F476D7|nr:cytochrome c [Hydrogenophaga sp. 2FB]
MKLNSPPVATSRYALAPLFYLGVLISLPAIAADEASSFALGKKLFTQSSAPACVLCHTLKDAGASGAVGPVLDELKPDAQRVAKALRNGIGQMPSYGASLSEAQILALAHYVSKASGTAN